MDQFDRLLDLQKEQVKVVISRYWAKPEITVQVNHAHITLHAGIADFIEAMVQEFERPVSILTRKRLRERLHAAANSAIEKVKESSTQAMTGA